MLVKLRIADQHDLDFIESLEKSSFPISRQSSRRSLKRSLTSPYQEAWLSELHGDEGNTPAGVIILQIHLKTIRIYSIAILPEHRGQGIGDFMMKHIIDMAHSRNFLKISLEADANQSSLLDWYAKFGFVAEETLEDYYAAGEPAVRMVLPLAKQREYSAIGNNKARTRSIIVVENKIDWLQSTDTVEVVYAEDYISNYYFQKLRNARIFNLCNSYKYQSIGYYVSLLASARDHRAIPNVTTIKDLTYAPIIRSISEDIDELIQNSLKAVNGITFSLKIYFGHTENTAFSKLAKELYHLFETPFMQISFIKHDHWSIKKITPLYVNSIKEKKDSDLVRGFAGKYFSQKRFYRSRFKNYKYNLAILINPDEEYPPSCRTALQNFKKASEKVGFYTEFITRKDYNKISEYDALFIRETTDVGNYTYHFSRHAYAEGLVVIDDPWSILRCSNKMYLEERMRKGRILTPKSWLLNKKKPITSQIQSFTYPVVLKKPDSCFSKGVYKTNNREELIEKLNLLFNFSDLVIAQEFIQSEFDWRIGIIDRTPLFACKYYMAKDHWQIYNWESQNTNQNSGDFETIPVDQVPPYILEIAVKATSFIGDGLYGVDLKEANGYVYLIEINDNPNIDAGIEDAVLKDDVYMRIMQSFLNRIERERNAPRYVSE